MADKNFELRYPSPQTAVDIFAGKWASDLSKVCSVVGTGHMDLFVADERPKLAAGALGNKDGRWMVCEFWSSAPLRPRIHTKWNGWGLPLLSE
jgi:hypothetical protein